MPDDGFYLLMLEKRDTVEAATQQCFTQLCTKLGYFNTTTVAMGDKKAPTQLTPDLLSTAKDPNFPVHRDGFFIFRSVFINAFLDGTIMLKLLKDILTATGEPLTEVDEKFRFYAGKSYPSLRTVYWFLDRKFICLMPPTHQISFSIDCLMFGSWQCNSPNVVGMHLVAMACMIGVPEFAQFLPAEMPKHPVVLNPPYKAFLQKKTIVLQINLQNVKVATKAPAVAGAGPRASPGASPGAGPGAGAGVAKTVEKAGASAPAKGAKDDKKKGAKDDKKGAKDDKKGAKDDKKKGAKDDKKGAKDDKKKGAKDDKKGAKDDKKGAKDAKKGAKK